MVHLVTGANFYQDSMMEDLITNARVLFDDSQNGGLASGPPSALPSATAPEVSMLPSPATEQDPGQRLHPLPPTPPGEPMRYPYGSRSTKVALPAGPEDFTPPLPPRPNSSIHPSARSPGSPTKEHFPLSPSLPPIPKPGTPPSPSVTSSVFESEVSTDHDVGDTYPTSATTSEHRSLPSDAGDAGAAEERTVER
jgi:hypothetical protein